MLNLVDATLPRYRDRAQEAAISTSTAASALPPSHSTIKPAFTPLEFLTGVLSESSARRLDPTSFTASTLVSTFGYSDLVTNQAGLHPVKQCQRAPMTIEYPATTGGGWKFKIKM
ncbi:hypothetical protein E4U60_006136 [Claviceps pazoutovae]|uniref:Uncharacterized protein n=1 Tax=Claviceps pazoutovae TaxID=1649127 RepID=A0A9P7MFY8_9HYPO|nr:hypothetical protein E4U60_006136 [Claviceps pazoutovae]